MYMYVCMCVCVCCVRQAAARTKPLLLTHFTCVTSTKVQILTPEELLEVRHSEAELPAGARGGGGGGGGGGGAGGGGGGDAQQQGIGGGVIVKHGARRALHPPLPPPHAKPAQVVVEV